MIDEFIGQIIDIFEDFLAEKNINIDNSDEDSNEVIICGSDYDTLEKKLKQLSDNWDITDYITSREADDYYV